MKKIMLISSFCVCNLIF